MGFIYSNVLLVVSWLGPDKNDGWKGIPWLDGMNSDTTKRLREVIFGFETQDYWNRIWILQETVLAHNLWIMSGTNTIAWGRFLQLLSMSYSPQVLISPASCLCAFPYLGLFQSLIALRTSGAG